MKLRRRSREGAWIEILKPGIGADYFGVAPVRERGLKSNANGKYELSNFGRSREGAWIEITAKKLDADAQGTSLP